MLIKRIISAVLCALMIAGIALMYASCSDSKKQNEDGSESMSENNEAGENARAGVPDNVPSGLKFSGETFTILSRDESQFIFGYEMGVETETGDVVNDAIYRRNQTVEERFDIDIKTIKIPGIWGHETSFNNTIRNSVRAGDNEYDLIAGFAVMMPPLAADGMFMNWKNVPYIDHSAPWWIEKLADEMTVDGKLYFISGDLSLSMISNMMVFYFNKKVQNDFGIEDLYQTVLDGKWTIDRLSDICKDVYVDLNGD